MANWKIMNGDEVVNAIVADRDFAMVYAEMNGYTAEEVIVEVEPVKDPVDTEAIMIERLIDQEIRIAELEIALLNKGE